MRRSLALVALVLLLSGCLPADRYRAHSIGGMHGSQLASDSQKLDAAIATYQRYLEISSRVGMGADPNELDEVLRGEFLDQSIREFGDLQRAGEAFVGIPTFNSPTLGELPSYPDSQVVMQVCMDFSGTDVLSSQGESVVASDRPTNPRMAVAFEQVGERLKIVHVEMVAIRC